MNSVTLVFVNLSRQDAHIWAVQEDGDTQFLARLGSGESVRQLSTTGAKWSIVAGDSYPIAVGDKNRVYLIGSSGVYEVENAHGLTAESGAIPADFDFPAYGGGGFP
jgi:hypothetical protein